MPFLKKHSCLSAIILAAVCVSIFPILGISYSDTNDEWSMVKLFRAGFGDTMLPSYFYGAIMVQLNRLSANVPWHSLYLWSLQFFSLAIFFNYIFKNLSLPLVALFTATVTPLFLYFSLCFSLTSSTNALFLSSFLLINRETSTRNFALFFLFYAYSCLGRTYYEYHAFVVLMMFGFFVGRNIIEELSRLKKYAFLLIVSLAILVAAKNSKVFDPNRAEMKDWHKFNNLRFEVQELGKNLIITKIPKDDLEIFTEWYANDADVVTTSMLKEALKETHQSHRILRILNYFEYKVMKTSFLKDIYFVTSLVLLGFFIFLYLLRRDKHRAGLFVLCLLPMAWYFCLLSGIRPIPRVNFTYYYFFVLFFLMQLSDPWVPQRTWQKWLLALLIAMPIWNAWLIYEEHSSQNRSKVGYMNEVQRNISAYPNTNKLLSIKHPLPGFTIHVGFELFNEVTRLEGAEKIVDHGSLARHPAQLAWLRQRGFKDFYDFVVDSNTRIYGLGVPRAKTFTKFQEYLDRHHQPCLHKVEMVSVEKGIAIAKMRRSGGPECAANQ